MEQALTSPDSRLELTFFRHLEALLVSACILGFMDTALVGGRCFEGVWTLVIYLLSCLAAGAWTALILAAISVPLSLALGSDHKRHTKNGPFLQRARSNVTFLIALSLGCVLLIRPWDLALLWPYWVLPLGATGMGLGYSKIEGLLSTRTTRLLFLGVGLLAFAMDALAYRRLYLSLHNCLFLVAVVFLARAATVSLSKNVKRILITGLLLSQGIWWLDLSGARSLGTIHGVVQPKLIAAGQSLLDRDGDGFSAAFAGGDCDDSNPEIHPGACERPGEAIDRNCNGHKGQISLDLPRRGPQTVHWSRDPETLPDIYLFVVDTLRADYGGLPRAQVAPEVESFSTTALDLRRAYTPYPSTFRAMISMGQSRNWRSISTQSPDFLSRFATLGYDAQLWISDRRLTATKEKPLLHLDRMTGDPFFLKHPDSKATWTATLVGNAIEEMNDLKAPPRVRWLHTLDPHQPLALGSGSEVERYKAAVRHASQQFGRLVSALDKSERGRRSAVLFVSDHGEEQGDHGGQFHGATLYEENVRIPLLMRLPGVAARRITEVTTLLDVVPTLWDYLGGVSDATWEGRSLLRSYSEERAIFSQIEPVKNLGGQGRPEMHAVVFNRFKLIHNLSSNLLQLYDLEEDPLESKNLIGKLPAIAKKTQAKLTHFQDGPVCQSF